MIAYHFPPFGGSSGVQRTLRFSAQLPDHGWEPIVLTAHPRAYERLDTALLSDVHESTTVIRAQAWDTKRHLAIQGRYLEFMARPDRWSSWWLGAVPAGVRALRRYRPALVWSTYPVATAHSIGASLASLSGLPWVADFRDPMAQQNYPEDPRTRRTFIAIERRAVAVARRCTFTAHGAVAMYKDRYPDHAAKFQLLENGYDDQAFASPIDASEALNPGRLTLLHSGVVYPHERDPSHFFAALEALRVRSPNEFRRLVVRFRAPTYDDLLKNLTQRHGVSNAIEILPPIDYPSAIEEIRRADGLLVLQSKGCNAQIPAKFYDYLGAERPMLLLADPEGDTALSAAAAGISLIAPLEDTEGIFAVLKRFCQNPKDGTLASVDARLGASRRARTAKLAALLDEIAEQ